MFTSLHPMAFSVCQDHLTRMAPPQGAMLSHINHQSGTSTTGKSTSQSGRIFSQMIPAFVKLTLNTRQRGVSGNNEQTPYLLLRLRTRFQEGSVTNEAPQVKLLGSLY